MRRVVFESQLAASRARVFGFHERPGAFGLLTPWWSGARVVRAARSLRPGETAVIRLGVLGWGVLAEYRHEVYEPPGLFVEVQVRGPFRAWRHWHRVLDGPHGGALLRDEIEYDLWGGWVVDRVVRLVLGRLFRYRHAVTRRAVEGFG